MIKFEAVYAAAVLARRRPQRLELQRPPAGPLHLRQLAAQRPARGAARVRERRRRPPAGPDGRRRAPAGGAGLVRAACSAPPPAGPRSADRAQLVQRALDPRLLRRLHAARACGAITAPPCARRWVASTGPAPRPPRCSAATWTAPCARASARRARSAAELYRSRRSGLLDVVGLAGARERPREAELLAAWTRARPPRPACRRPSPGCGDHRRTRRPRPSAAASGSPEIPIRCSCRALPSWSSRAAMIGSWLTV